MMISHKKYKKTIHNGISIHKPKRKRKTTGKFRSNCPECGKIVWDYNPYEQAYCKEHSCRY